MLTTLAISLLGSAPKFEVRKVAEKAPEGQASYRLYVNGRATALLEQSTYKPELKVMKTKRGEFCGSVEHTESGAYTMWLSSAFYWRSGKIHVMKETRVQKVADNVLFTHAQRGFWVDSPTAYLLQRGRFHAIGATARAKVDAKGRVTGWFYCDKNDRPLLNVSTDYLPDVYRREFIWRDGKRSLKSRIELSKISGSIDWY